MMAFSISTRLTVLVSIRMTAIHAVGKPWLFVSLAQKLCSALILFVVNENKRAFFFFFYCLLNHTKKKLKFTPPGITAFRSVRDEITRPESLTKIFHSQSYFSSSFSVKPTARLWFSTYTRWSSQHIRAYFVVELLSLSLVQITVCSHCVCGSYPRLLPNTAGWYQAFGFRRKKKEPKLRIWNHPEIGVGHGLHGTHPPKISQILNVFSSKRQTRNWRREVIL